MTDQAGRLARISALCERFRVCRYARCRERSCTLAFSKGEVADSLGVSVDFVEDHIWPELRLVRRGRKVFCRLREWRQEDEP